MQQDQNGLTAEEWAKNQFEFEYCCECGGDAEHHNIIPVLGNWFAQCKYQGLEILLARLVCKYLFIDRFVQEMDEVGERFGWNPVGAQLETFVPDFLEGFGVDFEDYLDLAVGLRIVEAYNAALGGKITLGDLWEDEQGTDKEERLPCKLALDVVGHGTGIWDEQGYVEKIKSAGAEVPHVDDFADEAMDWVLEVIQKLNRA